MSNIDLNKPYAAPQPLDNPHFDNEDTDGYLGEAQAVPAGNATLWLGNAWAVFKQQPLLWIGAGIVYFLINFALSYLPFIGTLLNIFLAMFLSAGFAYAAAQVEYNDQFSFGDIFVGFQNNTRGLLILGAFSLLFVIVLIVLMSVVMFLFVGGLALSGADSMAAMDSLGVGMVTAIMVLFFLAMIPYIAAFYLAPILVLLQDESPMRAITLSWQAFTRNIGGALLCSVILGVIMFISLIPFGLGLLVTMPLALILPYVVYRDIFFEE